jgi:CheY-like chemotaxis protein
VVTPVFRDGAVIATILTFTDVTHHHQLQDKRNPRPRRLTASTMSSRRCPSAPRQARRMGHAVRVAHDAATAVLAARSFGPDLGLLDIGLPDMDGCALAEHLGQEHPGIELAAITGYGDRVNRRRISAAGFHHYLLKPIDWEALEALVVSTTPT